MNLLNELSKFKNVTTTQKNAISSPQTWLVVFDVTLVKLQVYNGTTWVDLWWGGWGVTIYECTVWVTGADYTTLGAAITAGKTRILVIANTTETANITLPSNCIIHWLWRENVNINMWNYNFDLSTNNNFNFENLKISFAYWTAKNLFLANEKNIIFRNLYFYNNSSVDNCYILYDTTSTISTNKIFENIFLDLPNYQWAWIYTRYASLDNIIIKNWANTTYWITASFSNVSNIYFKNTSDAVSVWKYIISVSSCTISNLYSNYGINIQINSSVQANNISLNDNSSYIYIWSLSTINNSNFLWYITSTWNENIFNNCSFQYFSSNNYWTYNIYTWCRFRNQFSIWTNYNNFSNCILYGTSGSVTWNYNIFSNISDEVNDSSLTISWVWNNVSNSHFEWWIIVSWNNNTIVWCNAWLDVWWGANTITINAGATNTIVVGTRTDAAIVDNGTTSVLSANVVY